MKESCWKRGSKKDAEKISEAFRDLGACTCADYTQEDILYVLDGICGTLFMLPYESQTAEAIMDSHMFNELTLKVEPIFKVGDRIQRGFRILTINQVDCEKQQYIVGNKDVLRMTIPFREQSKYGVVNIPEPKFEVDDLVVLDDLLGRITDSKYEDGMWLYRVGCRNTWNFDYELMKADHRDEHRILKGGGL